MIGPTVTQVLLAFGAGTIFYIIRRVTGSLIWAMVRHGLWDFSTFALGRRTPAAFAALGDTMEIIAIVVALMGVGFVIKGADERTARD